MRLAKGLTKFRTAATGQEFCALKGNFLHRIYLSTADFTCWHDAIPKVLVARHKLKVCRVFRVPQGRWLNVPWKAQKLLARTVEGKVV